MYNTRSDIPFGTTRNARGQLLSTKYSNGFWVEYTYNRQGLITKFARADGYWDEFKRDESGFMITRLSSSGAWAEYFYDMNVIVTDGGSKLIQGIPHEY